MRGIYKITNTSNGKCYIGKSEDLAERIKYHITSLTHGRNKNVHMQNAYNISKIGMFTIEILEELSDEEDINEREKAYIKYYNANDRKYGYNKTDGGDGGNSYVEYLTDEKREELKEKAKKRMTGERNPNYHKHCFTDGQNIKYIDEDEIGEYLNNGWIPGVPEHVKEKERASNSGEKNGFYGKHHSDETIEKFSLKKLGENNPNYGKILVNKNGKQKFILPNEEENYLMDGWERGMSTEIKEVLSKNKTGVKTGVHSKNVKKYNYNGMIFYGWRDIKNYLNQHGYPTISEQSIVKISKGIHVRGYDELEGMISVI